MWIISRDVSSPSLTWEGAWRGVMPWNKTQPSFLNFQGEKRISLMKGVEKYPYTY